MEAAAAPVGVRLSAMAEGRKCGVKKKNRVWWRCEGFKGMWGNCKGIRVVGVQLWTPSLWLTLSLFPVYLFLFIN